MKRSAVFALSLALTSSVLTGQTATPSPSTATRYAASTPIAMAKSAACPVGFFVQRRSATDLVATDNNPIRSDDQRILISLQSRGVAEITGAEVLVHGVSARPAYTPLSAGSQPDTLNQTFHLRFVSRADLVQASLNVPHAGGIRSVDLLVLHYAKGEDWHAVAGVPCRAEPSLFLPVAGN